MRRLAWGLGIALGLALAAPLATAQTGAVAPDETQASAEEEEQAGWIKRLDEASARISAAQREVERLEGTKGRGASRRYPRGDAKEKYLADLTAAHEELDEAKEAMPEVLEEARRAGVPNGVLDRYESDEAEEEDDS